MRAGLIIDHVKCSSGFFIDTIDAPEQGYLRRNLNLEVGLYQKRPGRQIVLLGEHSQLRERLIAQLFDSFHTAVSG